MKWTLFSLLFYAIYAQDNGPVGRYYYAPSLYNDWMTKEQCTEAKGEVCWSARCIGSHQVNELCCCNIVYDLVPDKLSDDELVRAAAKPDVIEKAAEEA